MRIRSVFTFGALTAAGLIVLVAPASQAHPDNAPIHDQCASEFNNTGPQSNPNTAAPDNKIQVAPGAWIYTGSVNWSDQDDPPGNDDSGYNGIYVGDDDGRAEPNEQYVEYSGNHGGNPHGPHHSGPHFKTTATGQVCVQQPG